MPGVHSVTSIARPLDPDYATNRAVLYAMPLAAIVYAVAAVAQRGIGLDTLVGALLAALAALVGWALVRELAPDDQTSAFVGLAGSTVAYFLVPSASLLVAFSTLLMVRTVNRTVGLPARVWDSAAVTGLVGLAVYSTGLVFLGFAVALAFALDAMLSPVLPRQWVFGVLGGSGTLLVGVYFGMLPLDPNWIGAPRFWALAAVLALFALRIVKTREVRARGDATGDLLSPARVRAGMWVTLVIVGSTLPFGASGVSTALLVWVAVASLALGSLWRRN